MSIDPPASQNLVTLYVHGEVFRHTLTPKDAAQVRSWVVGERNAMINFGNLSIRASSVDAIRIDWV